MEKMVDEMLVYLALRYKLHIGNLPNGLFYLVCYDRAARGDKYIFGEWGYDLKHLIRSVYGISIEFEDPDFLGCYRIFKKLQSSLNLKKIRRPKKYDFVWREFGRCLYKSLNIEDQKRKLDKGE